MRVLRILLLVVSCCAVCLCSGLEGCGGSGDDHTRCVDRDGDGYGASNSSACPNSGLDCDDENADIYPDAPELCDQVDNQCQGDLGYGVVDDDAVCNCSFQGGTLLFTTEGVPTGCPGVNLSSLFPPGTDFGPVDVPGFEALPATAAIDLGPPVGVISVRFFSGGDDIRLEGTEPVQVSVPGLGTLAITATGAFCPGLQGGALAVLDLHVPLPANCNLTIQATGTPVEP